MLNFFPVTLPLSFSCHFCTDLPCHFFCASPWCRRRRHTTRYYAFISKYLDSTDLFLLLLLERSVVSLLLQPSSLARSFYHFYTGPSALVVFFAVVRAHYPALTAHSLTYFASSLALFTLPTLSSLHFFDSTLYTLLLPLLRTCQFRAVVAATQILDTQYPSYSGRHFFTPEPESAKVPAVAGTLISPQNPFRCTETAQKYGIPRLVGFAEVPARRFFASNLFQLLLRRMEEPQPAQHPTTTTTLIETNQLNYPTVNRRQRLLPC